MFRVGKQHLFHVLPNDAADLDTAAIAKSLLEKGIYSALQIASTPKKIFMKDTLEIFEDNVPLAGRVYQKAIVCRKTVALNYLNRLQ